MTVPPRKSTPRLSPRVARKNTASTNVTSEITLNTSAWRMNGMSRVNLKNSMMRAPLRFRRLDRRHAARLPHLPDRDAVELLAAAVDQRNDAARHEHPRKHRGEET